MNEDFDNGFGINVLRRSTIKMKSKMADKIAVFGLGVCVGMLVMLIIVLVTDYLIPLK
jgi:hypothetical protein